MADPELPEEGEDAQCEAPCSPVLHADDNGDIYCTGCGAKMWIIWDEVTD